MRQEGTITVYFGRFFLEKIQFLNAKPTIFFNWDRNIVLVRIKGCIFILTVISYMEIPAVIVIKCKKLIFHIFVLRGPLR